MYPKFSTKEYRTYVVTVIQLYNSLVKNHGVTEGTKRYKILYTYVYNLVENLKPDNPGWVATEKASKVPSVLKVLEPLIQEVRSPGGIKAYQGLQTIFALPRLSTELPELDLLSVVEPIPTKKESVFKLRSKEFREFLYKNAILPRTNQTI